MGTYRALLLVWLLFPRPGHKVYPYLLKDYVVERPSQVWCSDITYIPLQCGFLCLLAVMDWFSRHVLSWRLSNSMEVEFCLDAWKARAPMAHQILQILQPRTTSPVVGLPHALGIPQHPPEMTSQTALSPLRIRHRWPENRGPLQFPVGVGDDFG